MRPLLLSMLLFAVNIWHSDEHGNPVPAGTEGAIKHETGGASVKGECPDQVVDETMYGPDCYHALRKCLHVLSLFEVVSPTLPQRWQQCWG